MTYRQGRFEPPILVPVIKKTVGLPWYKQLAELVRSRKYALREDWRFVDSRGNICMIPAGQLFESGNWKFKSHFFMSDGTSWPRFAQFFFDKMGIGLTSALAHDFAHRYQVFLSETGEILREFKTRKSSDDEYRLIDKRVNGMKWLSNIKWTGVRGFSWMAWNRYRRMSADQTNALLLR